jgi:hypothetical protein
MSDYIHTIVLLVGAIVEWCEKGEGRPEGEKDE